MAPHSTWEEITALHALEAPPLPQPLGGRAWRETLHWRLLEDLFVLLNHCPQFPVIPHDFLLELRERATDFNWLVAYLEAEERDDPTRAVVRPD